MILNKFSLLVNNYFYITINIYFYIYFYIANIFISRIYYITFILIIQLILCKVFLIAKCDLIASLFLSLSFSLFLLYIESNTFWMKINQTSLMLRVVENSHGLISGNFRECIYDG